MADKKITKRMVLEHILKEYATDTMVVEYATHEIELLDKKASTKVATKSQKENAELKDIVLSVMTDTPARLADIQARDERLATLSNQKMTSLLTSLRKEEKVERVVDKKNSLFKLR